MALDNFRYSDHVLIDLFWRFTGETGGTLLFRAPECGRSFPELVDFHKKPTQDIYSFGLVVYQIALDGKPPYEDADDIVEAKRTDTSLSILLSELPKDTPMGMSYNDL